MTSECPAQLKSCVPFLKHATVLSNVEPCMSRVYAVQLGISLTANSRDDASKRSLFAWMNELEQVKAQLSSLLHEEQMGKEYVQEFSDRIFKMADDEDRTGNASRKTAQNFLASSQFYQVLTQFGELESEVKERQKYAKWKAVNITSCLKRGEKPKPGPPGEESENEDESTDKPLLPSQQVPSTSLPTPPFSEPAFPPSPAHQPEPQITTTSALPSVPISTPAPIPPAVTSSGYTADYETIESAQKHARFAGSALNYEDVETAVRELLLALKTLTGRDWH